MISFRILFYLLMPCSVILNLFIATDTLYEWPWYNKLIGAQYNGHPEQQDAVVKPSFSEHHILGENPTEWLLKEEWYNFKNLTTLTPLQTLDETSYDGGNMGDLHPISWCKDIDNIRSFYTGIGHRVDTYIDDRFLNLIWRGIRYTLTEGAKCTYLD